MSSPTPDLIAAIQMQSGAEVAANLATAGKRLAAVRAQGATLAVLPENFALMGAKDTDKLAVAEEPGRGPIQDFLSQSARKLGLWLVGGTLPLKAEPGRVAAACLVINAQGEAVARYDKIHLFDVEVPASGEHKKETYRESASIAPGTVKPVVVDTPLGKLGLSVCYDLRFPELYRALAKAGAQILSVPSAFTQRTGEAHWDVLTRARAVENQCYVVAPGQWGQHPGGRHTYGHSRVVDPWGRVLAQRAEGEGVVVAPVPLDALRKIRSSFPVLDHRRL